MTATPQLRIALVGSDFVRAYFERAPAEMEAMAALQVRHYGQLLLTRIKANASGRPGPNVITGDYRRSWSMRTGRKGAFYTAWVGTNAPQGRRLEYGFTGTDSLGRVYDQPPFPHVDPAASAIIPEFVDAIAEIVDNVK